MGITSLFSEQDHLAQLSSSFSATSGFYNSAKLSHVLTFDWHMRTYIACIIQCNYTKAYDSQNAIILHFCLV